MSKNLIKLFGAAPILWLPTYYFLVGPILSEQSSFSSHPASVGAVVSAIIGFGLVALLLSKHPHTKIVISISSLSIICCALLLVYAWIDYTFYVTF